MKPERGATMRTAIAGGHPYVARRARDASNVVFRVDPSDAKHGEVLATLDLPFVVE